MSEGTPSQLTDAYEGKDTKRDFATDWDRDESTNPRKGGREGVMGVNGYVPPIVFLQLV